MVPDDLAHVHHLPGDVAVRLLAPLRRQGALLQQQAEVSGEVTREVTRTWGVPYPGSVGCRCNSPENILGFFSLF